MLFRSQLAGQIGLDVSRVTPDKLVIHDYYTELDKVYAPDSKMHNTHSFLPFTAALLNSQLTAAAKLAKS